MSEINSTLNERGRNYGDFSDHADITQKMKKVMHDSPSSFHFFDSEKEAFDMIFHKIGRILNGNPHYADSWHDIAGYATLVEQILNREE